MKEKRTFVPKIQDSRFPPSLFFVYLGVLLLMSGIHTGLMVEELGSIETLKTDFLSNVSHEIKTPLAVIQNNAELLRMEKLSDAQREYADTIYQSSRCLSDLITNILKLIKAQ